MKETPHQLMLPEPTQALAVSFDGDAWADLRPPERPTFNALLSLWPTWLSYVVSYLFIAIVWANQSRVIYTRVFTGW